MKKFNLTAKPEKVLSEGESREAKKFSYFPIVDAVLEDGTKVRVKGQEQEFSEQMVMQQINHINMQLAQNASQKVFLDGEAIRLAEILVEIKKAA